MVDKQTHIDHLIREKLEQFHAEPPAHIWAGIERGIAEQGKPAFAFPYSKQLAVASALVLLALFIWYVLPENKQEPLPNKIELADQTASAEKGNITVSNDAQNQVIKTKTNNDEDLPIIENNTETKETSSTQTVSTKALPDRATAQRPGNTKKGNFISPHRNVHLSGLNNKEYTSIQLSEGIGDSPAGENENYVKDNHRKNLITEALPHGLDEMPGFKNYWSIGLYFSPEIMLNSFDSVTLMNSYAVNIEPSYYFSKHWFMRFGAGISYVRDRGFANVDYLSNDYIGSYDSVFNITFDTVGSELFPVYHTKEVEVWDSIRHLVVTEITNSYYNLQLPLLFGYHNSNTRFKWYFYGGPAINISVVQQFEEPQAGIDYIEIIRMENSLPQRTTYSIQMWLGAGIDIRIGQKMSLALEPNYRYYFKPNYRENNYKTALSGLSLRFGLIYKLN